VLVFYSARLLRQTVRIWPKTLIYKGNIGLCWCPERALDTKPRASLQAIGVISTALSLYSPTQFFALFSINA